MTEPTPTEATPAMRRRADLMVGLFVAAAVALLGGIVMLFAGAGGALAYGVIVVGVLSAFGAIALLRSIPEDERARLTAPKDDRTDGV